MMMPVSIYAETVITVTNPLGHARKNELAEIPMKALKGIKQPFVIKDEKGRQVPYQITFDKQLIFSTEVEPMGTRQYTIETGKRQHLDFPVYVYGRVFPEHMDDVAWENDKAAYRAYGPAQQRSGAKTYGYDIWSKSVEYPVLEQRFYDDRVRHISFHEDHGNGFDDYEVGPSLGAGTAALLDDNGEIIYPWCWSECHVLDNGPLRFTVLLDYNPVMIDGKPVTERRLISLDKGSWVNKTTLRFEGLKKERRLAQGIVVHQNNPDAYTFNPNKKYMTYQDLTAHDDRGNGQVHVGVISPSSKEFTFIPFGKDDKNITGHVAAIANYSPGLNFTYYWGSGWSKQGIKSSTEWNKLMEETAYNIIHPLQVEVRKK